MPFGCFIFCHLAVFYFAIWPFLLVAANKNQYILLVMDNKFDKIPILSRMVANVETEPLGSAFAYAGNYVKDVFFYLSNFCLKFKKNCSYVSYDNQTTKIVTASTRIWTLKFHNVIS